MCIRDRYYRCESRRGKRRKEYMRATRWCKNCAISTFITVRTIIYLYIYTIHTHSFLLYLSYHEHTFCDAIVLYGFLTHVVSRLLRGLSYSSDKPSSSGKLFFSANFKHSCCLYIRATRKMWPLRGALCSYKIFKHSQ